MKKFARNPASRLVERVALACKLAVRFSLKLVAYTIRVNISVMNNCGSFANCGSITNRGLLTDCGLPTYRNTK